MKIKSFIGNTWFESAEEGVSVYSALDDRLMAQVSSAGVDFKNAVEYGRRNGGTALRDMCFSERADMLKRLSHYLLDKKAMLYNLSLHTGATKRDSWIDIDGGIGTLLSYASALKKQMPDGRIFLEGEQEALSKDGNFAGQHILSSKQGVSVHINAFNFPCWGMLEKIAPSLAAGVAVIVKPATSTCYLTAALVQEIAASGILPPGALQLICGSSGDLLDHLREQDVVTFTGSAATGHMLRTLPNLVARSIPFNMEADSLNCAILSASARAESPELSLFVEEIVTEMTVKAGQKCTAIRRAIVPRALLALVQQALSEHLNTITIGDTQLDTNQMGALAGKTQVTDLWAAIDKLAGCCRIVYGNSREGLFAEESPGAFVQPTVLVCDQPLENSLPHEVEPFGPVVTLMPYNTFDEALAIAALGQGSLVATLASIDASEISIAVRELSGLHGRLLILNRSSAKGSTGHGTVLPNLIHGGPGRAGGGQELGGVRAIKHYMQRTAIQAHPDDIAAITKLHNCLV